MSNEYFLEYINCNLCGSDNFDVIRSSSYPQEISSANLGDIYSSSSESPLLDQLVKCKVCSLKYVNPRISTSISRKGYEDALDVRHHEQDRYRIKSFKRALKKVLRILELKQGEIELMTILDIGCASGAFLKAASDLGFQGIGLEPSKYLSNLAREKYQLEVYASTIESYAARPSNFSAVSYWDVLEHVPDPRKSLEIVKNLLQDDGILILNLPMVDTFPARFLGRKWPFYLNVHIYYFDRVTIRKLLDEVGFDVVKIKRYSQSLSLGYVLKRAGIRLNPKVEKKLFLSTRYYMGQRTVLARKRK